MSFSPLNRSDFHEFLFTSSSSRGTSQFSTLPNTHFGWLPKKSHEKLKNFRQALWKTTLILYEWSNCVHRFNFEVCAKKEKRWRRECELIFPLSLGACCSNGSLCLLIWKSYSLLRSPHDSCARTQKCQTHRVALCSFVLISLTHNSHSRGWIDIEGERKAKISLRDVTSSFFANDVASELKPHSKRSKRCLGKYVTLNIYIDFALDFAFCCF